MGDFLEAEAKKRVEDCISLIKTLCDSFGVSIAFSKKTGEMILIDNETRQKFVLEREQNG